MEMLPGWEEEILRIIHPRMENLAGIMHLGADLSVPVDTGYLLSQNYHEVTERSEIILGNHADYALFVECGHMISHGTPRKTATHIPPGFVYPQPFLRPQLNRYYGVI